MARKKAPRTFQVVSITLEPRLLESLRHARVVDQAERGVRPGLAAGDAIGANVTMLTVTIGLAALLRPLPMGHRVRQYAMLSAVAGGLALLALVGGHVSRVEGALLLAAYVGLVALVWWREKEPPALGELAEIDDDEASARRPAVALGLAVVGIALMLVGGDLAVRGAVRVVDAIGRSDSAVGLTILALATTAELFALVLTAARHDVPEIAVAGIVGSAAYNAKATLGAAALARPLAVDGVMWAAVVAAVLPLVILLFARRGHLGRAAGGALCAGYAAYAVLVLS